MNQNYTYAEANGQLAFSETATFPTNQYLLLPNTLPGFHNISTDEMLVSDIKPRKSNRDTKINRMSAKMAYVFHGTLDKTAKPVCSDCGCNMHSNQGYQVHIMHVPFNLHPTVLEFKKPQWRCPKCGKTATPDIEFQAEGHRITKELEEMIVAYLSMNEFTLTDVCIITGAGINTVKAIDKAYLMGKYTDNGKLRKPEEYSKHIGIDEFKLHNGHKFATHIIDVDTGHVLYIAAGKKKQVVFDFIKFVGEDWMNHVEAIAMDMNSDFQEAIEEECPWIMVVFDHFHLVKNFNDHVVAAIRKDEQKRLIAEGNPEAADILKNTRKILTANRSTLQKHDQEAKEGKVCRKGSELFNTTDYKHTHDDFEERYDTILSENKLLFTCDLIKQAMLEAYASRNSATMIEKFTDIIDWCRATENKYFLWFARLVENHFQGIINFGDCNITSSKIEGINNHIKVIRRKAYGLPDDEYFFLKIIDASHNPGRRI